MILDIFGKYVLELTKHPDYRFLVGRKNLGKTVYAQDFILVDVLTPSMAIGSNSAYDGVNEKEDINTLFEAIFTIEFFGDGGYENAYNFVNLQKSQLARNLQEVHSICVFQTSNIKNLGDMTANHIFKHYEIEVKVQYNKDLVIDTLRIDTIDPIFISN